MTFACVDPVSTGQIVATEAAAVLELEANTFNFIFAFSLELRCSF